MFQNKSFATNLYAPILLMFAALVLGVLIIAILPILQPGSVSSHAEARAATSGFDRGRVNAAYTARLTGLAGEYVNLYGSTKWVRAPKEPDLIRVRAAEAARLTGLAGEYVSLYGSTNWVRASQPSLTRAQAAQAARLTALAMAYGRKPNRRSSEIDRLIER